MNKFKMVFQILALSALFVAFSVIADAQATRTWVSGVGDDVNPCSRTAPCKTFAGAISKTATNGEITCLDPGGFGAVTVTKSITIDCSQVASSILASGSNGIIVNITNAADTNKFFRLVGVSINGAATGINGLRILAANTIILEDVAIDGFSQHGISLETSTAGLTKVVINKSSVVNNAGNGFNTFITGGATANISVNNSLFATNNIGFNLSQSVKTSFQNSIITSNTTGVQVHFGELTMSECQISLNGTGVNAGTFSGGGGTIRISGNTITGNDNGIVPGFGTIISLGNNTIQGNTVNGSPSSTVSLN